MSSRRPRCGFADWELTIHFVCEEHGELVANWHLVFSALFFESSPCRVCGSTRPDVAVLHYPSGRVLRVSFKPR